MADERIQMPSSGGGLVRYFDDYKSKLQFKPEWVVVFIIVVIIIELILFRFGSRFLG
ncbi:preprotein translocase subunit Sec61beta [Candidatus Woesearchaeota archaeon]|nr:preprotein translocase subunit Sec61beta [Candidatus Woesearchaeota archaeon]